MIISLGRHDSKSNQKWLTRYSFAVALYKICNDSFSKVRLELEAAKCHTQYNHLNFKLINALLYTVNMQ